MNRRAPTRESHRRRGRALLVVLALAVAATGAAIPAASYTAADVPRSAGVDVVDDTDGLVGLEKATTVGKNSRERLATVTNNADEPATVTVSLAPSSADGELYCGSGDCTKQRPETVVLALSPGASADVDVEATGSPTGSIVYDITGDAGGVGFELRRSASIEAGNAGAPSGGSAGDTGTNTTGGGN